MYPSQAPPISQEILGGQVLCLPPRSVHRADEAPFARGRARTNMPCNPVGRDSEVHASPAHGSFCASVRRRRKCSHRGGSGRSCDVPWAEFRYGSRDEGLGWCCRSKGGPPWKDWKKRSCSLPRTVWEGQNASRVLDCAAVVIVVLLPDRSSLCLSVCLVLSLRVSDPWEPERLFASVPRAFRTPLLLPRGSVVPYQNAECTTRERICRASNSLEVGRLVESQHAFQEGPPGLVEGSLHGCMACVAACAAGLLVQRSCLPMRKYSPLSAENAS